jgi:hypothetical protein
MRKGLVSMADRYTYMTTAELEDEAADRGVDLDGATTNPQRADRLRAADAERGGTSDDRAALGADKHGDDFDHGHAPYPSRADLNRRAAVAGGEHGDLQAEAPTGV